MAERDTVGDADGGTIGQFADLRHDDPTAILRPYDARFDRVARVANLIESKAPQAQVEHVGSTPVPGPARKGVVDLLLPSVPARLATARAVFDRLAFQRHDAPGAFPEERPVRLDTIHHDGATFRLHVHVVAANPPEAAEKIACRDRLRANPTLMAAYVDRKRAILAVGVANGPEHAAAKDPFIREVGDAHAPNPARGDGGGSHTLDRPETRAGSRRFPR